MSAHCRLASLASAWGIVMLSGVLGPLLLPLAAIRFITSAAQTWLNIRLGKSHPVNGQTRFDYVLIGLIFVGAYVAVGIGHVTGNMTSPVVYVPMLIPFSVLQVRMMNRSYRAHTETSRQPAVVIPFPAPRAPEEAPAVRAA
jgi:hypothetical protein